MKLFLSILTLIFALNANSQNIDFNKPERKLDFFQSDLFGNISSFDSDFYFEPKKEFEKDFSNTSELDLRKLSIQISKEALFKTSYKNHSQNFINHCGPLEDGLYLNTRSSDVMLSRLFDTFVNDYFIGKWLFPKDSN